MAKQYKCDACGKTEQAQNPPSRWLTFSSENQTLCIEGNIGKSILRKNFYDIHICSQPCLVELFIGRDESDRLRLAYSNLRAEIA